MIVTYTASVVINCTLYLLSVGQFWNVPVIAFGPVEIANDEIDVPFVVTVVHPLGSHRSFVADLFPHTWDRAEKPCLYAGNSQGGPISMVSTFLPNDPVIEGRYYEYEVTDGIFGSDFKYNHLESRSCS